jgi:hypothetical protein
MLTPIDYAILVAAVPLGSLLFVGVRRRRYHKSGREAMLERSRPCDCVSASLLVRDRAAVRLLAASLQPQALGVAGDVDRVHSPNPRG